MKVGDRVISETTGYTGTIIKEEVYYELQEEGEPCFVVSWDETKECGHHATIEITEGLYLARG